MQINFWNLVAGCGILLLMGSCRSMPFQPETYTKDYLVIGNGGGYTGLETSYFFTAGGDVFQQSGRDTTFEKIAKVKQQLVKQSISSIKALDLMDYQLQNPGNTYKFLFMDIDGKSNKVVWGNNEEEVNPAITNIYRLLNQSLQNNK